MELYPNLCSFYKVVCTRQEKVSAMFGDLMGLLRALIIIETNSTITWNFPLRSLLQFLQLNKNSAHWTKKNIKLDMIFTWVLYFDILKLPNIWTMIMQSFVVLFWLCLIENGIVNSLFNLWSSRPSFSFQRGQKTFKTLDLKIQTRESKSENIGSFFLKGKTKIFALCLILPIVPRPHSRLMSDMMVWTCSIIVLLAFPRWLQFQIGKNGTCEENRTFNKTTFPFSSVYFFVSMRVFTIHNEMWVRERKRGRVVTKPKTAILFKHFSDAWIGTFLLSESKYFLFIPFNWKP